MSWNVTVFQRLILSLGYDPECQHDTGNSQKLCCLCALKKKSVNVIWPRFKRMHMKVRVLKPLTHKYVFTRAACGSGVCLCTCAWWSVQMHCSGQLVLFIKGGEDVFVLGEWWLSASELHRTDGFLQEKKWTDSVRLLDAVLFCN